jgi:hypothetical protein
MRWTKLILGTLVLAVTLQPLLGQTAKTEVNTADSSKAKKFDLARASEFNFAQTSNLAAQAANLAQIEGRMRWQTTQPNTQPNQDLCYSMRVYSFRQQDDQTPQMTGSTTCTPANRAALESIEWTVPKSADKGIKP